LKKCSQQILRWYHLNKRDLPWRESKDPYSIWLSEVILQQTRIEQGKPYYLNFIQTYPKVENLADAPEDDVLKMWQGLGYYSRARNLHKTAKLVANQLKRTFPKDAKGLKNLPGIGDYTAAAVSSISYGERIPVLDGNVYRVLSRLFDIDIEIGSSHAKKYFTEVGLHLMADHEPGDFNQAMMEFGALQCVPVNPHCESCVLINHCKAYELNNISLRPVVKKKKPIKNRFLNYFLIHDGSQCYVNKRSEKDIWQGLYDFPLMETDKVLTDDQTPYPTNIVKSYDVKHMLTHQRLNLRFFVVQVSELPSMDKEYLKMELSALPNIPVPKPIETFLSKLDL